MEKRGVILGQEIERLEKMENIAGINRIMGNEAKATLSYSTVKKIIEMSGGKGVS